VEKYHPERNFFLALLKDSETGFLHEGTIIRENEDQPMVMTAETIDTFLNDYKAGKLHPYLKTEKLETKPEYVGDILKVYGSNFISLVKELNYAPAKEMKGLILFFTRQNCPKCEWLEAYFDQLVTEFSSDTNKDKDFQFAIMDVDQNSPTSDLKQFLSVDSSEPLLQFLAVLPDGGTLKRFQKENDSYEKLQEFVENVRYLVKYQNAQEAGKAEKAAEAEMKSEEL
jgi:thiol-disulfide isomerase/thioredoxin